MFLFNFVYLRQAKTSYKTIERAYGNIEVRQILEGVFELTNEPVADLEHEFGSDGTGLTTSCKQNYENGRQKNQTHKGYEKIVAMVGLKYKLISSFKYAAKSTVHESLYFESLLVEFVCWYGWVGLVVGVCGFLSWGICGLVVGVGVVLCFYLRKIFLVVFEGWCCLVGGV